MPNAKGDFRIGAAKFDRKLAFTLHTPLTRRQIRERAQHEFEQVRNQMKLIQLKWYLRAVTNALLDQGIHVDGMSRDEAMKLMVEGGYQEEREAALKWVRAQLGSTQLSTYFVGYQEHADLRRAAEEKAGPGFDLRKYHEAVLAHGSPPVQFVRALMLDQPIRTAP